MKSSVWTDNRSGAFFRTLFGLRHTLAVGASIRPKGAYAMEQNQNAGRCEQPPLVMAYVPWQPLSDTWDEARGLERGTIFPDLFYPFTGREAEA